MEAFNRLMVALDNTIYDRELLTFASYITEMVRPEKVYFTHVDPNLEIPDSVNFDYLDENNKVIPKDELLRKELEKQVGRYFDNKYKVPVHIDILEGKPLNELLHWTKVKKVDLVMVGKKKLSEGSGITAKKLAREAECSMIFVPPSQKAPVRDVVVPFDFSTCADLALKTGLQIVKQTGNAQITAVHVFDVPILNRYELTMDYDELVEKVRKHQQARFEKYLEKEGLHHAGIQLVLKKNASGRTAKNLNDIIAEHSSGMVVIGAKGISSFNSFLLGSVTEKLMDMNSSVAMLIERTYSIR